jgi:hypothetical protein
LIRLFSKDLPRELSKDIYFEYQRLSPLLTQAINRRRLDLSDDDRETIYLLLAMSVFYNKVVMPLAGASSFSDKLLERNIASIMIGDYRITPEESAKMKSVVYEYHGLMKAFGLEKRIFDFKDTRTFLDNALLFLRGQLNE